MSQMCRFYDTFFGVKAFNNTCIETVAFVSNDCVFGGVHVWYLSTPGSSRQARNLAKSMADIIRPGLPTKLTLEQVKQALKLTSDNISRLNERLRGWDYTLQHGTELLVESPVPYQVTKAYAVRAVDPATNLDVTLPVSTLVRQVTPGVLGITVQYDMQHTQPQLALLGTTNQSVPNNAAAPYTTVIYEATESSRGSVIAYNAGTFSVSEAGSYQIMWSAPWEPGATYTDCETWIRFDPNGTFIDLYGYQQAKAALTDANWQSCGALIRMSAGAQFQIKAYQTNAATLARTLRGTATAAASARRININRLYNDSTPTARVSIVFSD